MPCLALPFSCTGFEISLNFPSRNLEGGTALPRPDQEVLHKPHFLHTTQTQTQTMATPPNSNMSPAEKAKAFDMAQLEMEYRVDLYNA